MTSVCIIGGGPAGLSLSYDLSRRGFDVTLFEAAPETGGLARSFQFGDIKIERYYHFLCGDDHAYFSKLKDLNLSAALAWSPTQMGFFLDGHLYPFASAFDLLRFSAIPLTSRMRYGLWALRCSLQHEWRSLDNVAAKSWLIDQVGLDAYRATWHPLLDIKFHEHHDSISAAWVWHRVHRVSRSRSNPLAKERLGYLEGGTDVLLDAMVSESRSKGAEILVRSPIRHLHIKGDLVEGIETVDGSRRSFDHYVSAVPLPQFLRMAPDLPGEYRNQLESIEFIGVVCAVFRLRQPLTQQYWLNVNDVRIPFNGCIEYTNLNAEMTPDGSSIVYVPFYVPTGHGRFRFSDERIIDDCTKAFKLINKKFSSSWVMHTGVSRDPYAQVICTTGFANKVPAQKTPIGNLALIESSQLYPADRTISGTIELANSVVELLSAQR